MVANLVRDYILKPKSAIHVQVRFQYFMELRSKIPFAVDGGWTAWSSWSSCIETCGGGLQSITRDCTDPTPSHGGQECAGEKKRFKYCNNNPCPGKRLYDLEFQLRNRTKSSTMYVSSIYLTGCLTEDDVPCVFPFEYRGNGIQFLK